MKNAIVLALIIILAITNANAESDEIRRHSLSIDDFKATPVNCLGETKITFSIINDGDYPEQARILVSAPGYQEERDVWISDDYTKTITADVDIKDSGKVRIYVQYRGKIEEDYTTINNACDRRDTRSSNVGFLQRNDATELVISQPANNPIPINTQQLSSTAKKTTDYSELIGILGLLIANAALIFTIVFLIMTLGKRNQ